MSRIGASGRTLRRLLLVGALLPVLAVLLGGSASAHPLGNFTVNQYSGLQISRGDVRVDYVLDLAEIPTFQARASTDRNGNGTVSPAELRAYAAGTCAASVRHLDLRVAGRAVPLRVGAVTATQPPGQAGLPTTRVSCAMRAVAAIRGRTDVTYADTNLGDRVGWREITAVGDGTTVTGSSVPARTVSRRLSAYPKDLLKSPLDVRTARVTVRPGGAAAAGSGGAVATSILPRGVDALTTAFSEFVGRRHLGPGLGLLAVGLALLLGAAHALAPGHGKTVMAAFLLGRGSSLRAALTVGATVTATHTFGVLCLGIVLSLSSTLASEQILPYLGLLSGLMLAAIGGQLLRSALAGRPSHDHGPGGHTHGPGGHTHGPGGHDHDPAGAVHGRAAAGVEHHAAVVAGGPAGVGAVALAEHPQPLQHEHPHPHGHPHPQDHEHDLPHSHDHPHPHGSVAVPSRRNLVAMGVAGGLVPSPSALVVLLGAIGLHRAWFGVVLVVCYGLGMAATLTAAGLLLVRARALLVRPHRVVRLALLQRAIPVLTAVVIIGVGLVLSVRAASVALGSF